MLLECFNRKTLHNTAYSALLQLLAELHEVLGDVGGLAGRPRVVDGDRVE